MWDRWEVSERERVRKKREADWLGMNSFSKYICILGSMTNKCAHYEEKQKYIFLNSTWKCMCLFWYSLFRLVSCAFNKSLYLILYNNNKNN